MAYAPDELPPINGPPLPSYRKRNPNAPDDHLVGSGANLVSGDEPLPPLTTRRDLPSSRPFYWYDNPYWRYYGQQPYGYGYGGYGGYGSWWGNYPYNRYPYWNGRYPYQYGYPYHHAYGDYTWRTQPWIIYP